MDLQAKEFLETSENLLFAVVSSTIEDNKVLACLRYHRDGHGQWRKLDSDSGNELLRQHFPHYLHHSPNLDADLHAVPLELIRHHYRPREVLQRWLECETDDPVVRDLQALCQLLSERGLDLRQVGVTGSLLAGLQKQSSDMDLVIYDRPSFQRARAIVQELIAYDRCQQLSDADWLDAYRRRGCDFPLDEYIWHEQRKYNKAMFNQRKFDLSLLADDGALPDGGGRKLGKVRIEAQVVDDRFAFDFPARYRLSHSEVDEVVSFTATYSGQAQQGERVLVSGQLEDDQQGGRRIVVGSNREAIGEFIRVLR